MILKLSDAHVTIDDLSDGKKCIYVKPLKKGTFISKESWITEYPIELIKLILKIKGPLWLCDEIMRDEDPSCVHNILKHDILGYVDHDFDGKRILDFGCGSGASTMVLAKMFPKTKIIGIELDNKLLTIAKASTLYILKLRI